jgi:hypothetical protein
LLVTPPADGATPPDPSKADLPKLVETAQNYGLPTVFAPGTEPPGSLVSRE